MSAYQEESYDVFDWDIFTLINSIYILVNFRQNFNGLSFFQRALSSKCLNNFRTAPNNGIEIGCINEIRHLQSSDALFNVYIVIAKTKTCLHSWQFSKRRYCVKSARHREKLSQYNKAILNKRNSLGAIALLPESRNQKKETSNSHYQSVV